MISRVQTSRINKGIQVCEVLYLGTRYNLKVSALAQRKVESFGEALTRTPKLFTGQKQRLYQHSAVCPMRSFPMCPRRPRRGEAKQLVADGAEVCSHACFMKHNSPPASFSPLVVPTDHWLMVLLVLRRAKKKKTDTKGWHTWRDKLMSTSPLPSHVCFVHQFRGEIIAADMIKIKNSPQKRFPMLPAAARLTNHVSYRGLRKRDGSHWVPPGWMSLRHTAEHWWTLISSNSHTAVEACKSVGAATREKHKIPCKEELGTKYCKCF